VILISNTPGELDLREHVTPPALPARKLGRRALHAPPLKLADYLEEGAKPPAAVHRSHIGFSWGMLANDQLGDCGEAMVLHAIEAFHLDAGTPVPAFTDQDAIALYSQAAGYDPADPSTDQGTDNAQLVQSWQSPGVTCAADSSTHTIAGSLFVDPANVVEAQIAIWEFVVLFRAIALPAAVEGANGQWTLPADLSAPDAQPGSYGGHDVPYLSYDGARYRTITWGQEWLVDVDFDQYYAEQGFVVVTREMLNRSGISPSGVNWSRLNADLAALPSVPAA
jgi:hypothetical protein